jgi:SlyX protein
MNDEALHERIDKLEIRIAYQDEIIDDLNTTIVAQWKQIDALTRQVALLVDRVQEAEGKAGGSSAPEPPPPHY